MAPQDKHCDDYIDDLSAPMPLRWFLFVRRLPATDMFLCQANGVDPSLYADYTTMSTKGRRSERVPITRRVRVVMASRLGDVGITFDLNSTQYRHRVPVSFLSNFGSTP